MAHKGGQNGLVEIFAKDLKRFDTVKFPDQHYLDHASEVFDQVLDYSGKKKIWMKAFEILQEILVMKDEFNTEQEKSIYKFQLIINYLNQTDNRKKLQYITNQLRIVNVEKKSLVTVWIPQLLEQRMEARRMKDE